MLYLFWLIAQIFGIKKSKSEWFRFENWRKKVPNQRTLSKILRNSSNIRHVSSKNDSYHKDWCAKLLSRFIRNQVLKSKNIYKTAVLYLCLFRLLVYLILHLPYNTPRVFHVETTWKRSLPRRFNVENTGCV